MPGVIQPQRPQGILGGALSAIQTAASAKSAFGGSGQQPTDTAQQPSAGNVGDSTQAAQGQAVQTSPGALGDYPSGGNVFQRRMQR